MRLDLRLLMFALLVGCCSTLSTQIGAATTTGALNCRIGTSSQWGSSWCDLQPALDLAANSTIEIHIDPHGASVVLVRLLPEGGDPDSPNGIVGGATPVTNGTILIPLSETYTNIKQISVHGGPNPWDYNLGVNNKGAKIINIIVH
jgi:hypothetical protein